MLSREPLIDPIDGTALDASTPTLCRIDVCCERTQTFGVTPMSTPRSHLAHSTTDHALVKRQLRAGYSCAAIRALPVTTYGCV